MDINERTEPMRELYTRLRARSVARLLRATTFCDACGEVCTPDCHRTAQQERYRVQAYTHTLFR